MKLLLLCALVVCPLAPAAFVPTNRPYDVQNYKIVLTLNPDTDGKEFHGKVEITLKAKQALTELQFDRKDIAIAKVVLANTPTALAIDETDRERLTVKLPYPVAKDAVVTLNIAYFAKIGATSATPFFKVTDPDDAARGRLYFTHFEPNGARTFFPCNDEPYDKATTEMVVTVPQGYLAISNGKLVAEEKLKEYGRDLQRFHWKLDKPHSTYLVSLAVGKFAKIATDHDGKEVSVYLPAGREGQGKYALDTTVRAMRFFENFVGVKYPWNKYATVALPTFTWGGMENTTATSMNQDRTLLHDPDSEIEKGGIVGLASHELAHQWFGDYATLAWWDDLWLNESFASYLDSESCKEFFDPTEVEIATVRTAWDKYFRQENGPRSHPIVDKQLDNPEEAFDAISYTKGENVLRMLEHYVGRDALRAGMKRYLEKHAYGNANYRDFFDAVATASGRKLDGFRDSWLLQRGYPVVSHSSTWSESKRESTVTIRQKSNHATDKSVFDFRLPVVFHRKSEPAYEQLVEWPITQADHTFSVSLPAAPEWITVNRGSVVLAKVEQEKRDEKTLALQALHDSDPLARVRASYDLAGPLLENTGTLSKLATETLIETLQADPSAYVRLALLDAFREMKTRWLPKELGESVFQLSAKEPPSSFDARARRQWRATLLAAYGKVNNPKVMPYLVSRLEDPKLPLDELAMASLGVAALAEPRGVNALKEASRRHAARGYRYRYVVDFSFGAFEDPAAAHELQSILSRCTSDLAGKIGSLVSNNQTLKKSPQWANTLEDLLLKDLKHGDEVASRLLHSIEEVKNEPVRRLLDRLQARSASPRIKGLAKKIRDKNFGPSRT